MLTAEVQGARRWTADYEIIVRHGLSDQGRECGGLEGLIHSLRSIALAMDIARDVEKLAPRAMMLVTTNPMPRVVTAINRYSSIPAVGFCSAAWGGYPGYQWLARLVDRRAEDIDVTTAGLNHFAWLLSIHDRTTGVDLLPLVESTIDQPGQSKILRRWLREYGAVGVVGDGHMGEFLPYDPDNHYCSKPPFHGNPEERRAFLALLRDIAAGKADWRLALEHRSWERPVDVAMALYSKTDAHFDMLNIPNHGSIPQLPEGRIVEIPARAGGGKLEGIPVPPLPDKLAAVCNQISDVIELTAQAAVEGNLDLLRQIIDIDVAIGDKPTAHAALPELLEANADILPGFG